jgi:hypothetical protein
MKLLPFLLASLLLTQAAAPAPKKPVKPRKETFWEKVLRITGLAAMPSTTKGSESETAGGDLWRAGADGGARLRLTRGGGYRSPVFEPSGRSVLALAEDRLVRIATDGISDPEPLWPAPGVVRLLAYDRDTQGQVVVLTRDADRQLHLASLDLANGKIHPLQPPESEGDDRRAMVSLQHWDRAFRIADSQDVIELLVREKGKGSDVYLLRGNKAPVDVSRCEGDPCGQPSLSFNGRWVIFVRAGS